MFMIWAKYDQNEFGTVRFISKEQKTRLKSIRKINLLESYSKVGHTPDEWSGLDVSAKVEALASAIRLTGETIRVSSCSSQVGGAVSQIQGLPVSNVSAVVEAVQNELGSLAKIHQETFEFFVRDHVFGGKKPIEVMLLVSSIEIADFSYGNVVEKSKESVHDSSH
jgi:hypothetical protein